MRIINRRTDRAMNGFIGKLCVKADYYFNLHCKRYSDWSGKQMYIEIFNPKGSAE